MTISRVVANLVQLNNLTCILLNFGDHLYGPHIRPIQKCIPQRPGLLSGRHQASVLILRRITHGSRRRITPHALGPLGGAFLLLVGGGSAAGCSGGVLGGGRDHPPRRSLPLPAGSSTRCLQVHWFRHTAAPLSIQWVEIHQELTAVSSFAGK